jgi:hypothetical protein
MVRILWLLIEEDLGVESLNYPRSCFEFQQENYFSESTGIPYNVRLRSPGSQEKPTSRWWCFNFNLRFNGFELR